MTAWLEGLLTTWGREFCAALSGNKELCGQDAYEVYIEAFGRDPDVEFMAAFDESHLLELRNAARKILEDDSIQLEQIHVAVSNTVAHWG